MTNDTNTKQTSGLSKFNLLLIIIIGILVIISYSEQQRFKKFMFESLNSIQDIQKKVDFSLTTIQQLSDGFMLADASQKKHLTGIEFTGRIINTQSINHSDATFNLSVNGKNKEFTINKISSGNSTQFNVYIPELDVNNARYAQIKYIRSSISFYTK